MNVFYDLNNWVSSGLKRYFGVQNSSPTILGGGGVSEPVTFDSAMQLSAVWACVKLLAETISSLPVSVYKTTETGRKIDQNNHLNLLFNGKVNRYQTKIEFFETFILNLVIHGNAYAVIQRLGDKVIGLLPLMSSQMQVTLLNDGSIVYEYTEGVNVTVYAESSIWHLKLLGNGITGLSPIDYQRKTLGIAQNIEKATAKIYDNGGVQNGVLTLDKFLSDPQRELYREKYKNISQLANGNLIVLEGGMKFEPVSLTPQDVELLSSRKYSSKQIYQWYGVPGVMVNDADESASVGSNTRQIIDSFYVVVLRPILEKIEMSAKCNLMTVAERQNRDVEFDFNALTRSDQKTRYEAHRIGIYGGFITPNEARSFESLPKMTGGDELYMQGANVRLDQIQEIIGQDNGNQKPAP